MKILKVWIWFLVAILMFLYMDYTGIVLDIVDRMIDPGDYGRFANDEIMFIITLSSLLSCIAVNSELSGLRRKNDELQKKIEELREKE